MRAATCRFTKMCTMATWGDQIALVTGTAGSIGGAIAKRLSALGARVATSDMQAVIGAHRFLQVDVTRSGQVDDWVEGVRSDWGPPTIAIICAGKVIAGRLADQSDADWRDVMGGWV